MELTNSLRKLVRSLDSAKNRREHGLFVAEGTKCVLDTLAHFRLYALIATGSWLEEHRRELASAGVDTAAPEVCVASRQDISRLSLMKCPPEVIAVYHIPETESAGTEQTDGLVLALDCVQDPGNLGTIVRTADWMGVRLIIASRDTADVWAPKVVQATMGAIARVKVAYVDDLAADLAALAKSVPVYGTFLDGENIYTADLVSNGVVVMGNEGRGVSDAVAAVVSRRLLIPSYPPGVPTSESLNVATATAIVLSEFVRKNFQGSPRPSASFAVTP